MPLFESFERRINQITPVLEKYGFENIEATRDFCLEKGIDVSALVRSIQPIAFENAVWAYTLGCAIALKEDCKKAADAADTALYAGCAVCCIERECIHKQKQIHGRVECNGQYHKDSLGFFALVL